MLHPQDSQIKTKDRETNWIITIFIGPIFIMITRKLEHALIT